MPISGVRVLGTKTYIVSGSLSITSVLGFITRAETPKYVGQSPFVGVRPLCLPTLGGGVLGGSWVVISGVISPLI